MNLYKVILDRRGREPEPDLVLVEVLAACQIGRAEDR